MPKKRRAKGYQVVAVDTITPPRTFGLVRAGQKRPILYISFSIQWNSKTANRKLFVFLREKKTNTWDVVASMPCLWDNIESGLGQYEPENLMPLATYQALVGAVLGVLATTLAADESFVGSYFVRQDAHPLSMQIEAILDAVLHGNEIDWRPTDMLPEDFYA